MSKSQAKTHLQPSKTDKMLSDISFLERMVSNNSSKKESSNIIKAQINDAYSNSIGGFGYGNGVAQKGANFSDSKEITWNFININQIYRTQPLIAKISNTMAFEMTKAGIDLRCEIPPDEIQYIEQELKQYNYSLSESANWGFMYGLSACLIYLDGEFNDESLATPLDLSLVTPNSFKGLKTFIRWQGIMPRNDEFVEELDGNFGSNSAEDLGQNKYYDVWLLNSSKKYKVHRSRLLIFDGFKLPGIENQIEQGCGVSLVERLWLPFLNYLATINYVQNMLQLSQQRILWLAEADRIGLLSAEGQKDFKMAMKTISDNASINNLLVLDQNDEFEYKSANFANIDNIIQSAQEDFAAAACMPLNKLFGKSPTGLNNSSKENLIDYYDYISRLQNMELRENYTILIKIIYKSKYGKDIPEFSFDFKSLFMPDEQEKALIIDRKTRPLQKAWETNAIRLYDYMLELKEIGKTSDCFTNITDETLNELKKSGLCDARYCDFGNGYIINSEMATDLGQLKKLYKENQKNTKNKGEN